LQSDGSNRDIRLVLTLAKPHEHAAKNLLNKRGDSLYPSRFAPITYLEMRLCSDARIYFALDVFKTVYFQRLDWSLS